MRIVAVGECTIDRYLDTGVECVGGISLNFAINARRAGAEQVGLVSCIGTDAAAAAVKRRLAGAGIDARHVRSLPGATASQQIRLTADGERLFPPGGYDPGVLAEFRLQQADIEYLRAADVIAIPVFVQIAHLLVPILQQRNPASMRVIDLLDGTDLETLREFGASGAIDRARRGDIARGDDRASLHPGPDAVEPFLDAFDVTFISGDESTVERLLPLSNRTRSVLVVTHGAAGSSALVNGVRYVAPAEPVPVHERIDTTGCGDAFQAAFTVDYFRNRDVRSALREGARRAAVVIRHLGATSEDA
jgi:fructoselysine 6-kinase